MRLSMDLHGKILLLQSHYGPPPLLFTRAQDRGVIIPQTELRPEHLHQAAGLITTNQLDQIGLMAHQPALEGFLDRGGRWFFSGHMLRVFTQGLRIFQPMIRAKQSELFLTKLSDHPIFAGIAMEDFYKVKGVAGFYGRGHNPLPQGAQAVTGVGPEAFAIDWDWARPKGGRIFSHAGNDFGAMGGSNVHYETLIPRILDWCLSGERA